LELLGESFRLGAARAAAAVALLLVGGLCAATPAWAPAYSECSDGIDQDDDGLVDLDDSDCADQADEIEGRLTLRFSAALTRRVVRFDFYPASRLRVRCHTSGRRRCRFSVREGARFPYKGVLVVWAGTADWTAGKSCASGMPGSVAAVEGWAAGFRSLSACATWAAERRGGESLPGTPVGSRWIPSVARCGRLRLRRVVSVDAASSPSSIRSSPSAAVLTHC
jgi:hypothetical protein